MAFKYFDGCLSDIEASSISSDNPLKESAQTLGSKVDHAYQNLQFSSACEHVLTLVRMGNKYIDEQAPWRLYKQGEHQLVQDILYSVLESVRLCGFLLSPIIPQVSSNIYQQLGLLLDFTDKVELSHQKNLYATHSQWGVLPLNQQLGNPSPIFHKLESPTPVS